MSPELMTAIGVIILGIFTGFIGFMKYVFDKILAELKPNGGTSLKDQVNRLEQRVDDIYNVLLQSQIRKKRGKRSALENNQESS
jgi:hypothetical protein